MYTMYTWLLSETAINMSQCLVNCYYKCMHSAVFSIHNILIVAEQEQKVKVFTKLILS